MPSFSIESNGRLEKTAVYYNGEQLGGVKEIFINLDEDGTFDAVIQYEGTDKEIHSKQIFSEYLTNAKFVEPSFTEEESELLREITIESDGLIENTSVFEGEEIIDGIVSLLIHIKGTENKKGLSSIFSKSNSIPDTPEFKAEITFRNEDDTLETEDFF